MSNSPCEFCGEDHKTGSAHDDPAISLRDWFEKMPHDELVYHALALSDDCERLRRELDEATGAFR